MIKNIYFLLGFTLILVSCSSDKNEAATQEEVALNAIIGTWDATELSIDNATANDNTKLAKGILDLLTDKNCYIVTLMFNEDLTAQATNSAGYVEINLTGSSLDVPCPTQSDMQNSTYTYDGKVVTTTDANGNTITIDVSIDGNTMTVDATDLEIPDFTDSGQLIFEKR